MGLKNLKSNLDLLGGFGNEGGTLGEMEGFSPTNFQLGTDDTSKKHIDSLGKVPGGSENSAFQDMNGEPGPQFQRSTDVADQAHISSLAAVPGGSENSAFQDMNNGAVPTQYIGNLPN